MVNILLNDIGNIFLRFYAFSQSICTIIRKRPLLFDRAPYCYQTPRKPTVFNLLFPHKEFLSRTLFTHRFLTVHRPFPTILRLENDKLFVGHTDAHFPFTLCKNPSLYEFCLNNLCFMARPKSLYHKPCNWHKNPKPSLVEYHFSNCTPLIFAFFCLYNNLLILSRSTL